jgi:uncharacterized phiE125 gp8 family phage protein
MDNFQYIKVGQLFWLIQAIPESATGNTVTVEIRRLSDNYTWNFSTTAFVSGNQSGNMTFITGILWKQSFTPPTEDTYIVTINNETLDVKYVQVLKALGAVAQAGVTGTELTTVANLKEYLDIETANTDDDTFLQNLITRISDDIEKQCDRAFHATDRTEYYKGDGTSKLLLKQYPVNTVASIYDDVDRVWGADTQIEAAAISISDRAGGVIILEDDIFSQSDDVENIKITYNAGYSTIPTDLESACIKLCAADYLESKGLMKGVEEGERNADKIRKQAEKVLKRYKRIR